MRHTKLVMIVVAVFALIIAGCDREITGDVELADQSASNCFDCHSDQDFAVAHAQDQFEQSLHATGHTVAENRLTRSNYVACEKCHTHEGFVANVDGLENSGDHFTHINCFTCHAPHSQGSLTVRVEDAVTLADGTVYGKESSNVCASCHQSRSNVATAVAPGVTMNSRFGPHHSNQSDMLIGTNAYEFAGYTYTTSWHGLNIDDGCVTCHMADKAQWAAVGGHTFAMNDASDTTDIIDNVAACTGCHENFTTFDEEFPADIDYDWDGTSEGVQTEIVGLLDSLSVILVDAGLLTADGTPESVTAGVDSLGAVFNYVFVLEDQSFGIHNTNYTVALLQSSINYMVHGDPNGEGATVASRPRLQAAH